MLMKYPRLLWLLIAMALLGGIMGYFISVERPFFGKTGETEEAPDRGEIQQVVFDFPEIGVPNMDVAGVTLPSHVVKGELVVQFTNRTDYQAYLQALADAETTPLGRIDELLVVRITEGALQKANLGRYKARAGFSYRVERPLPPVAIVPEALASLRSYGVSAREIAGGPVSGDGDGVMVAILDSGIVAHPQFDDVYIVHIDLAGGGVAGPGSAHGTSVASIIAGSEGLAPNAELFVVRVLDDKGLGSTFHVAEGIVQAVDLGVEIINMSLGVYQDTPLLREAVNYASERGVILVAAAGNDGYDRMPYPAAYPEVLSVTAVDAVERQALFPNQSEAIDFAAPGFGILTAKEDSGTTLFSGTSAAAPFVSGTLASLMTGDAALEPKEAVEILQRYLNERGASGVDSVYGAGVVDWNRLRERAVPNVMDVALADIYLQPDAAPGTTMPVEVTVQNRGTKWFSGSELEVFIGEADAVEFTLGSLGPGQTTSRKVFTQIPSLDSDEYLSIAARVIPRDIEKDVRLENNLQAISYTPVK